MRVQREMSDKQSDNGKGNDASLPSNEKGRSHGAIKVLAVFAVGIGAGIFSFFLTVPHIGIVSHTPFGEMILPLPGSLFPFLAWHFILSTVSIALLVSLVVV